VDKLPRLLLWISELKMGKKLLVSEVPEAGASISHCVGGARDVVDATEVAVVALMQAVKAEKKSGRADGGGRTFPLPGDSRNVVAQCAKSTFSAIQD
jgi:hypothetical protein